jgi:hypothetical protein
VLSQL